MASESMGKQNRTSKNSVRGHSLEKYKRISSEEAHWIPLHFVTVVDHHQNSVSVNFTLPPPHLRLVTFDLTLYRIDGPPTAPPADRETRVDHVTFDSRNSSNITFADLLPGTYQVSLHPFEHDDDGNCICFIDYEQCSCTIKDTQEFIIYDVGNPTSWWGQHQIVEVFNFISNPFPSSYEIPLNSSAHKTALAVLLNNAPTKPWAPFDKFAVSLYKTPNNATRTFFVPSNRTRTLTHEANLVFWAGDSYANNSGKFVMPPGTLIKTEQKYIVPGEDFVHMFNDLEPGDYFAEIRPVESKFHCYCHMLHSETCVTCEPANSPIISIPTHKLRDELSRFELNRLNSTTSYKDPEPTTKLVGQGATSISPGLLAALLPAALIFVLLVIAATIIYLKMRPFRRKECVKKFGNLLTHPTLNFRETSDRKSYTFKALPTLPTTPRIVTKTTRSNGKDDEERKPLILLVYANDDPTHAYAVDRLATFLTARCRVTVAHDKAMSHDLATGRWEWIQHNLDTCDWVLLINSPFLSRHYASRLSPVPQTEPDPWFAPGASEVLLVARQIVDATLDRYWLCNGDHTPNASTFKSKLLSCRFDHTDPACVLPLLSPGYVYRLMDNVEELLTTIHGLDPKHKRFHFDYRDNCPTAPIFGFTRSNWATCGGLEGRELRKALLICANPTVTLKSRKTSSESSGMNVRVDLCKPDPEQALIVENHHTSFTDLSLDNNYSTKLRKNYVWKNYDSVNSLPAMETSKAAYDLPDISFSLSPPISGLYGPTSYAGEA